MRILIMLCTVSIMTASLDAAKPKIHTAAAKGKLKEVKSLATPDAVHARDEAYNTPLHLAAKEGKTDVAEYLIKQGANLHARNAESKTPLHMAVAHNKKNMVRLLIDKHADVNAQAQQGRTPLHIASEKGHKTVMQMLLENGAYVNVADASGKTPLYLAVREGHFGASRMLLDHEAQVNTATQDKKTALYKAVTKKKAKLVTTLLAHGADPSITTRQNKSIMQQAVASKDLGIISRLVAFHAPWPEQLRQLPAHGEIEQARNGTMPALKQLSAEHALRILAGFGHNETIIQYLLNNTIKQEHQAKLLGDAAMVGNFGLVKKLIAQAIGEDAQVQAFEQVVTLGTAGQAEQLVQHMQTLLSKRRNELSSDARAYAPAPQPQQSQQKKDTEKA